MKCKEIIEVLEKKWPVSYALPWDNVGLLVGSEEKEVKRIFVTLDVTEEDLNQAAAAKADMIISHHPLLFSAVKQINDRNFIGKRIISLIKNDLSYYAMHTNFDVKSMAQLNGAALELQQQAVLMTTTEGVCPELGIGRVGMLKKEMTLLEFAEYVKTCFKLPTVQIHGNKDRTIAKVAVSGGSGKDMVSYAVQAKADVLVSGDFDYHTGIDAIAEGIALIDAGHYGTEYMFIEYVVQTLSELFTEVEVSGAKTALPSWVI